MEEVIKILQDVNRYITDNSDMMWTSFSTPAELRAEIEIWITELQKENTTVLESINTHFAPAFTFQEHSLQNDWTDAYHVLALRFDKAYTSWKKSSVS